MARARTSSFTDPLVSIARARQQGPCPEPASLVSRPCAATAPAPLHFATSGGNARHCARQAYIARGPAGADGVFVALPRRNGAYKRPRLRYPRRPMAHGKGRQIERADTLVAGLGGADTMSAVVS